MGPHACGSKYKREAKPKPSSGKGDEEKENLYVLWPFYSNSSTGTGSMMKKGESMNFKFQVLKKDNHILMK